MKKKIERESNCNSEDDDDEKIDLNHDIDFIH